MITSRSLSLILVFFLSPLSLLGVSPIWGCMQLPLLLGVYLLSFGCHPTSFAVNFMELISWFPSLVDKTQPKSDLGMKNSVIGQTTRILKPLIMWYIERKVLVLNKTMLRNLLWKFSYSKQIFTKASDGDERSDKGVLWENGTQGIPW